MVRYLCISILTICLLSSSVVAQAQTLAFPGAEGFGRFAKGGRGGRVIEVTNLNDSGPGSLRAAFNATGPRTVVFRVGGTITLKSSLFITNPFITVAGQTAPGDGILIRGSGGPQQFGIERTSEVIFRYMRVRMGFGSTRCAMCVIGAQNIIVDHNSFSWTADDLTFALGSDIDRITFQWNIIAESFDKGLLIGNSAKSSSVHHNFFAHNFSRNPKVNHTDTQIINNTIYNASSTATLLAPKRPGLGDATLPVRADVIGNYYKPGVDTFAWFNQNALTAIIFDGRRDQPAVPQSTSYTADNFDEFRNGPALVDYRSGVFVWPAPRTSPHPGRPTITTQSAVAAKDLVIAATGAGANRGVNGPNRDSIDTRVINDFINGTGRHITNESQVGGYPVYRSGTPPQDTDHDGMPDSWETLHGFNSSDPADGPQDANGDGYTNLEEYLNELAGGVASPADNLAPAPPTNLSIGG